MAQRLPERARSEAIRSALSGLLSPRRLRRAKRTAEALHVLAKIGASDHSDDEVHYQIAVITTTRSEQGIMPSHARRMS